MNSVMKFLIATIIFVAGIGFGVGIVNVDQLIIAGADTTTVWASLTATLVLWPMAIVLYWVGEQL
jgi:hypothetical protein